MDAIVFGSTSDFICFLISLPFVDNLNPSQREEFLLFGAILCDVICENFLEELKTVCMKRKSEMKRTE